MRDVGARDPRWQQDPFEPYDEGLAQGGLLGRAQPFDERNTGSDSTAGFRMNRRGQLAPIVDSVRPLSDTDVASEQIQFSPGGRGLVIAEKTINR
jgi:hypothetical protein